MKYEKPSLSFEEQADLLISRGLQAEHNRLVNCLERVNYYRLSGYLYSFRQSDESFIPDTSFEKIYSIYCFDRAFRLCILDGIEWIEIALRTQMSNAFTQRFDSFEYVNSSVFPQLKTEEDHKKWIKDIRGDIGRSREEFIKHFKRKYGDSHDYPPLWMAIEVFTLGKLLTMFSKVDHKIRKDVASFFKVPDVVFESWLRALNGVRNISAHHGRLWNRVIGYKPLMLKKRKHPEWHVEPSVSNDKVFIIILIMRHLLRICAPESNWNNEIEKLIDNSNIQIRSMGFPVDWKNHPVWKS